MTETQIKFLMEYLGEKFHDFKKILPNNNSVYKSADYMCLCGTKNCEKNNRTFTELKDKQDLLEKVIENGEWKDFVDILHRELVSMFDSFHDVEEVETEFLRRFTMLSPLETAELICKWKGVE